MLISGEAISQFWACENWWRIGRSGNFEIGIRSHSDGVGHFGELCKIGDA
jgi:hypothetical protein